MRYVGHGCKTERLLFLRIYSPRTTHYEPQQDNPVNTVTRLRSERPRSRSSIPCNSKKFFSSWKPPDLLWDPQNLLFNGYPECLRKQKIGHDVQLITHFKSTDTHHHLHIHEGLGVFPVPWSSKWSWSLHLFFGRPMFLRLFGLYCSACFVSLFVSILCTCCSKQQTVLVKSSKGRSGPTLKSTDTNCECCRCSWQCSALGKSELHLFIHKLCIPV
jgi:hypothetical protein